MQWVSAESWADLGSIVMAGATGATLFAHAIKRDAFRSRCQKLTQSDRCFFPILKEPRIIVSYDQNNNVHLSFSKCRASHRRTHPPSDHHHPYYMLLRAVLAGHPHTIACSVAGPIRCAVTKMKQRSREAAQRILYHKQSPEQFRWTPCKILLFREPFFFASA